MGTSNAKIIELVRKHLVYYGYKATALKVTDLMKSISIKDHPGLEEHPTDKRYDSYIKYANKIRELYQADDILAILSCAAVSSHRKK
jgi:hypothetical protein